MTKTTVIWVLVLVVILIAGVLLFTNRSAGNGGSYKLAPTNTTTPLQTSGTDSASDPNAY